VTTNGMMLHRPDKNPENTISTFIYMYIKQDLVQYVIAIYIVHGSNILKTICMD